jgi:high affinity Mn2+ porin
MAWTWPEDTVVVDGLSSPHRDCLADGGLGSILGDGRLSDGPGTILELYYKVRFEESPLVSPDHRFVDNPGYERHRDPASILGPPVPVEF